MGRDGADIRLSASRRLSPMIRPCLVVAAALVAAVVLLPAATERVLTVADHLSFRGAARELGFGQRAVSRRLRALEDALGVWLFERSHGG
jgi:hypothetical protein